MPTPNLGALRAVADRLDGLGLSYAFVGGSIVNLLIDDPSFAPARPTDDVDGGDISARKGLYMSERPGRSDMYKPFAWPPQAEQASLSIGRAKRY